MHTRYSKATSPLLFDPEIEKTARKNRVLPHVNMSDPENTQRNISSTANSPIIQPAGIQQETNLDPNNQPLNQPQQQHPPRSVRSGFTTPHRFGTPTHVGEGSRYMEGSMHERVDNWDDGGFDDRGYDWNDGEDYVQPQNLQYPQYNQPQYVHQGPRIPHGPPPRQYRRGIPPNHQPHNRAMPNMNYQPPPQGVDSHFRPAIAMNASPIVPPVLRGRAFEVRPQCLSILPSFYGKAVEEPYLHVSEFEAICGTIGGRGFSPNEFKIVLFQFTLKDKAKQWFLALPSGSIFTWAEMQQQFLDEYYTMQKTSDARNSMCKMEL